MDTTKSHGFFLASFLVLVFLGDLTEACSCRRLTLRDAYCRYEILMRAKFMSVRTVSESTSYSPKNIFTIQPVKIYKGPNNLQSTDSLYSEAQSNLCGYEHKGPLQGEEYLFSGTITRNRLEISLCSFAEPWDNIPSDQKSILQGGGYRGC